MGPSTWRRDVKATDNYAEAGVQELVILALKAHQVDAVADQLGKLMGPDTVVVTMQNGIPFWYFHRHGGPFEGHTVKSVDPTGELASKIAPDSILGCVVYPAAELIAPGVIRHVEGDVSRWANWTAASARAPRRFRKCSSTPA